MNRIPTLTPTDDTAAAPREDAGFGLLDTAKGPLPLKAMTVQTRIDGLLAATTVRQTFVNCLGDPLEATYIFPLPDRAAVTHFRMEVAGRVVEGILKERGAARREYDEALQAGKRAAIAEEERPGVFTLRVGNLMPGEEAVVQLTFTGPLSYSGGEAEYRFPLVVAPRYIPGTPFSGPSVGTGVEPDTDAVPDASRITPPVLLPGFPNPVRLGLSVELRSGGLPLTDVRSSLHAVEEEAGEGWRRLRIQPDERLNRDFILRFRLADRAVETALSLQPDVEGGKEGTFLLTLLPPVDQAAAARPRELIFILDRSGSMAGWKMVAARRALARMVDTLNDRDRFTIYAFDDRIETPGSFAGEGTLPATDRNRYRAVEFLARIDSRGGTELAQPLDRAVTQLAAADPTRDRILVLVTDGQVGNEDQILRKLGQRLQAMRIFTLGVDRAVNEGFLRRLACLGGGCYELVESEDRLDEVMDRIHRRIGMPVLTDLKLTPAGLEVDQASLTPGRLPDLFAGAPLFLMGRYRGAGSIALHGRDAAGRTWTQKTPGRATTNRALTWTWARGRVRDLEDRYAAGTGERLSLEKEIVATSLRFGVLCRFTAFVAVDVKEVVNAGGKVQRITQPVEAAEGWDMLRAELSQGVNAVVSGSPAYSDLSCRSMNLQSPRSISSLGDLAPAGALDEMRDLLARNGLQLGQALEAQRAAQAGGRVSKKTALALDKTASSVPDGDKSDLIGYRRRGQEMLRRLRAAPADQLTMLGRLAVELAALIEDLRSVGATETTLKPLVELHDGLNRLLLAAKPKTEDVNRLWSLAENVLQAFGQESAGVTPAPASKKREGFWK